MDSRTAFIAHSVLVLICASFLQFPLEFIAVELIAGLVAIYSLWVTGKVFHFRSLGELSTRLHSAVLNRIQVGA
jgi:hypothetical protein